MKVLIWIGCILTYIITTISFLLLGFRLGYILTLAILCCYLPDFLCKKWDIRVIKKEASAKGMSINQYVESIVSPSLIASCEKYKYKSTPLRDNLRQCVKEKTITKPMSVVLFEMYK